MPDPVLIQAKLRCGSGFEETARELGLLSAALHITARNETVRNGQVV